MPLVAGAVLTIAVRSVLAAPAPSRAIDAAVGANAAVRALPRDALIDASFIVRLSGFRPGAAVEVTAMQMDAAKRPWRAALTVKADGTGRAALADPMALITDMKPPFGVSDSFEPPAFPAPIDVYIAATAGGRSARAVLHRRAIGPNIRVRAVDQEGVKGLLFEPADRTPRRGVVMLGGSEGGQLRRTPALVASHGFRVLSLAYFGAKGLPDSLVQIPIETAIAALEWLSHQENVEPGGVYVEGESRGGELAILAAIHSAQARGVIAVVPTPIVFSGLRFGKGPIDQSPWMYQGRPLPYITFDKWRRYQTSHDASLVAAAVLPLARLRAPLLIIAGEDDKLALSATTSRLAIDEARAVGGGAPVTLLSYRAAGHMIGPPFEPTENLSSAKTPYGTLEFGGDAAGYARADADSWPQMLAFLRH